MHIYNKHTYTYIHMHTHIYTHTLYAIYIYIYIYKVFIQSRTSCSDCRGSSDPPWKGGFFMIEGGGFPLPLEGLQGRRKEGLYEGRAV